MDVHSTILKTRARPVGTGSLQSVYVGSLEYGGFYICSFLGFFFCILSDVCLGSKPRKMIGFLPIVRGEAANGSPFLLPFIFSPSFPPSPRLYFLGNKVPHILA